MNQHNLPLLQLIDSISPLSSPKQSISPRMEVFSMKLKMSPRLEEEPNLAHAKLPFEFIEEARPQSILANFYQQQEKRSMLVRQAAPFCPGKIISARKQKVYQAEKAFVVSKFPEVTQRHVTALDLEHLVRFAGAQ
ncbi:hypothetical protein SS50377_20449 [Spironucleus salmonicida]|uniref:Uncharacterized protein n=1 Tax=Spironucleus salmonicida TaxID=348837 RepID=V6LLM9_9EUKA|nr:hypothetical protein SS50377_20449 [Spironucleus salmonicida]|eukprot:EST45600.1 Hypothetical protein SS50377_14448 [Spironucleus salmonicida]